MKFIGIAHALAVIMLMCARLGTSLHFIVGSTALPLHFLEEQVLLGAGT